MEGGPLLQASYNLPLVPLQPIYHYTSHSFDTVATVDQLLAEFVQGHDSLVEGRRAADGVHPPLHLIGQRLDQAVLIQGRVCL